ncbi:hypothetical protein U8527_13035 [Kordia algicida OT-1]|uniref:Uncharacterized protein n=1 Tax=Kordia algicida OT-1 TaxID=391587 RepID=A9E4Z9_9FLAO|nr:hypothetical protein [Kordia algicida]EDP95132.1 hypothetical protein KAOT1_06602 [Kordia algicida OT-1]
MTVIDALYGSQYYDLKSKGYDVQKGRLYGNLLFAATIMIYLFVIVIFWSFFSEDFTKDLTRFLRSIFGRSTGKMIGKVIAIPLIAIIYLMIALFFGSKKQYEKRYETYVNATKEEKDNAVGKMVVIFAGGLLLLVVLSITSLFL